MIPRSLQLLLMMSLLTPVISLQAQSQTLVLVAHKSVAPAPFTSLEIRKLFLGAPLSRDVQFLPLINASDPLAKKVFVQSVMAMSPRNFERQLLRSSFTRSELPAKEYQQATQLWQAFSRSATAISFFWRKDLPINDDYQIVQVLWQGDI